MKKIIFGVFITAFLFACNDEKKDDKKTDETTSTTKMADGDKKPASELLDVSAGDGLKNSFMAFSKGDIDGMTAEYDDNIRYTWSGGDSLIGKQAVKDYYAGRWKLIESLTFSNHIVLPVQINESQAPEVAPPGKWVLHWAQAEVTYKNSKKITFWSHTVNHYNDAGKIDFVGMYMDRLPIMEATKDLMPK